MLVLVQLVRVPVIERGGRGTRNKQQVARCLDADGGGVGHILDALRQRLDFGEIGVAGGGAKGGAALALHHGVAPLAGNVRASRLASKRSIQLPPRVEAGHGESACRPRSAAERQARSAAPFPPFFWGGLAC